MQSLKNIYINTFPQSAIRLNKFPIYQPTVSFLNRTLPTNWKSKWADRDIWHDHPSFNKLLHQRDWVQQVALGCTLFGVYLAWDMYDIKYGKQAVEVNRLEEYMKQREIRLAHEEHSKEHHH